MFWFTTVVSQAGCAVSGRGAHLLALQGWSHTFRTVTGLTTQPNNISQLPLNTEWSEQSLTLSVLFFFPSSQANPSKEYFKDKHVLQGEELLTAIRCIHNVCRAQKHRGGPGTEVALWNAGSSKGYSTFLTTYCFFVVFSCCDRLSTCNTDCQIVPISPRVHNRFLC